MDEKNKLPDVEYAGIDEDVKSVLADMQEIDKIEDNKYMHRIMLNALCEDVSLLKQSLASMKELSLLMNIVFRDEITKALQEYAGGKNKKHK